MLTVAITIFALIAASAIAWYGLNRMRAIQRASGQLTGPVDEMKEQLLLTADSAVDRLDDKMAQMEILLAELDRRSNLLAQQSQRQQTLQSQLEQQQQQLSEWFLQQRRQLEQEFAAAQRLLDRQKTLPQSSLPNLPVQSLTLAVPDNQVQLSPAPAPLPVKQLSMEKKKSDSAMPRPNKPVPTTIQPIRSATDKRTLMLELAEQGLSVEEIAKQLSVGKGEVMLLLKLRKKITAE